MTIETTNLTITPTTEELLGEPADLFNPEKLIVYLGGPIEFATREEQDNWREHAREVLTEAGHFVIDPTGKEGCNSWHIVEKDLRDLQRADVLLAWVPVEIPLMGTAMEIFYFRRILRKPVVAWGRHRNTPWLDVHVLPPVYGTLEHALQKVIEDAETLKKL